MARRRALLLAAIGVLGGLAAGCATPPRSSAAPAPVAAAQARSRAVRSAAGASAGADAAAPAARRLWTVGQPRAQRERVAVSPISVAEAAEAAAEARMVSATFAFMGDQGGSRLLRSEHPLWTYQRSGDQSLGDLIQRRAVHAVLLELLDGRSRLQARLVIRLTYSEEERPLAVEAFDGLAFRRKLSAAGARIGSARELRVFLDATECPPYCTDDSPSPVPLELEDLPLGEVWCTGRVSANCDATVFLMVEP